MNLALLLPVAATVDIKMIIYPFSEAKKSCGQLAI